MTATEAISYCLRNIMPIQLIDGEIQSHPVNDKDGNKHWIAWLARHGDDAVPELCSESHRGQFTVALEPYEAAIEE